MPCFFSIAQYEFNESLHNETGVALSGVHPCRDNDALAVSDLILSRQKVSHDEHLAGVARFCFAKSCAT